MLYLGPDVASDTTGNPAMMISSECTDSKSGDRAIGAWVRIPPLPLSLRELRKLHNNIAEVLLSFTHVLLTNFRHLICSAGTENSVPVARVRSR
jgi:hypothetical protein